MEHRHPTIISNNLILLHSDLIHLNYTSYVFSQPPEVGIGVRKLAGKMASRDLGLRAVVRLAVRLAPRDGRDRIDGWARDATSRAYLKVGVAGSLI